MSTSDRAKWFQDARFGMFVHWGLYSLLGRGEWVMHTENIPAHEYEQLAKRFNPTRFNADEWVMAAIDAGMRYMVVTSRHHDGFSMFDTRLSNYKVTLTPFARDPLRELADACARRREIKLGFYVSTLDWHHPAYRNRKESGQAWSDYVAFLHGQVRELCAEYGEVGCIWLDGDWPREADLHPAHFRPAGKLEYERLYAMIHSLQPSAVILNNRHAKPLPGEDAQGFERDLPGQNYFGQNTTEVSELPFETCQTINDSWGYTATDDNHKSPARLAHLLARAAGAGANLLLNAGPAADGALLPAHTRRLQALGNWTRANGEAIYGARAGLFSSSVEWASTRKGDVHYLFLFTYDSDQTRVEVSGPALELARSPGVQATLLRDGQPVRMSLRDGRDTRTKQLVLTIPLERRDPYATVVKISN